jgi:hypothetical protein
MEDAKHKDVVPGKKWFLNLVTSVFFFFSSYPDVQKLSYKIVF